jgi:tetrahydromethanopterin S-methyltransferase subunit D
MVMLWVNLATTLSVSMGWLRGRYVRATLFGGIGGPVAYYSGAKLAAMTAMPDLPGFLGIGLAWAIALPLLYGLRDLLYRRFPDPLKPGCE